jgi:hypothetical protein
MRLRPLVDYACPLPDGQLDTRSMPHGAPEDVPGFGEVVAGVEHTVDFRAVFRPLLYFVKILRIRLERVVGLLGEGRRHSRLLPVFLRILPRN